MKNIRYAVSIAIALTPSVSYSQEFKSIESVVNGLGDDSMVAEYSFMRCAALPAGAIMFGGENYPLELQNLMAAQGALFLSATAKVKLHRAIKLGLQQHDVATYEKQATDQIMRVANIYAERMQNNSDMTGNSVNGDPLISSDFEFCKGLRPLAEEAISADIKGSYNDAPPKNSASEPRISGICSYSTSNDGWGDLKLKSKGKCTSTRYTGTGMWVEVLQWENGNKITYSMDSGDGTKNSKSTETINGRPVIDTRNISGGKRCWLASEGKGYSASCFEAK